MARMIPWSDGSAISSVAERLFFEAVSQLDDEFSIFHGIPWLHVESQSLRQGECDFLVLHPALGIISIEAKPGDVRYNADNGQWIRNSSGRPLKYDPYQQAQRSVHTIGGFLARRLPDWRERHVPLSFAVYFSGVDEILGHFPIHASPAVTLLEPDLSRLADRLTAIARLNGDRSRGQPAGFVSQAIAQLRPEFSLFQKFTTKLNLLESELMRMTQRQLQVLDLLRENRRVLVKGCAGSGKTVMALEKATRLAREGAKVLLLCYNIPLADWMRSQIAAQGLNIEVQHFHGLCESMARRAGIDFQVPEDSERLSEFYDETAARLLEQAAGVLVDERFDAIIVDEGQDFIAEWWIVLESLLRDSLAGCFYVFYDPEQNIFGRRFDFLKTDVKITLETNCRNTSQIVDFINKLASDAEIRSEFGLDGPAPEVVQVHDRREELQRLEKIVSQLVQHKRLDPNRVVIVGARRRANSSLAQVTSLAGIPLIDEVFPSESCRAVRYTTIFRFKGLEADCVILLDFEPPTTSSQREMLYCAASRAKFSLHVIYREGNECQ